MLMTADSKERVSAIREAESLSKSETNKRRAKAAQLYVKVMKKVAAEGEEFTRAEMDRTNRMVEDEGAMSQAKRDELKDKINVIRSITWQAKREP